VFCVSVHFARVATGEGELAASGIEPGVGRDFDWSKYRGHPAGEIEMGRKGQNESGSPTEHNRL
jgi:hypothetical protein